MNRLVAFVFALILTTGCQDEEPVFTLEGSWEVRGSVGGLTPSTGFPRGTGPIVKFSDGQYERFVDGVLQERRTYEVSVEKSFIDDRVMRRLIYDGNESVSWKTFFEFSGTRLIIYDGAPRELDGRETVLERISD